jgi:hypothetical protein
MHTHTHTHFTDDRKRSRSPRGGKRAKSEEKSDDVKPVKDEVCVCVCV